MKSIPTILSLAYQNRIAQLCQELPKIGNLRYFVCYIVFNNGQTFVLSNTFHMLMAYYGESLYKQDFSFRKENTISVTHYLGNQPSTITENFKEILEQRFGIYRSYYIIRNCPECQFIFGAIKDTSFDNFEWLYKATIHKFEDFCCDFVDGVVDIIKEYNPTFYNAIVLGDSCYRRSIIKTNQNSPEKLTAREIECLYLAANGKSSEETAKLLHIGKTTVDTYRNEVKRKLNAINITHAVFEAIKFGYIGAFNKNWTHSDAISINGLAIARSLKDVEAKIKTNLWLLNKESLMSFK